jgi:mannose-6-phosphate isomerase
MGKNQAWVIHHAAPRSPVYAGLQPGWNPAPDERAIAEHRTAECLHSMEPCPGQCLFIPAGTVHALGAGLLVAEIQQASDTTYRLFDWDRLGPDGRPRALHIPAALAAIDESAGPVAPERPRATGDPRAQRLVACDKFVLERWTIPAEEAEEPWQIGGDDRFHLVSVLEGAIALEAADPAARPFSAVWLARGQTALLPAALGAAALRPQGRVVALEMYLPDA